LFRFQLISAAAAGMETDATDMEVVCRMKHQPDGVAGYSINLEKSSVNRVTQQSAASAGMVVVCAGGRVSRSGQPVLH
jgi:hypothetical protein